MLFPVILVSTLLQAQQEADTLPPPMQEDVIDSEVTAVPDEDTNGTTESHTSIYFLQRSQQPNGGGPDAVRWKKLPDTLVKRLQADNDFWYVNYEFNKEKKKKKQFDYDAKNGSLFQTSWFQTLLWILIIGMFVSFVIIYLANSHTGLFRRKDTIIHSDDEMAFITDNIFEINYLREIDKAISNGNYRFAVRLMFLRVLKNLSDTKMIQYTPDRTNFDYLMQLQSTGHYTDFFRLTRNYEYSWYGHFDIDAEKFSWIRRDFEDFDQKLK